ALEVHAARFVGAVFAPHNAVDTQLSERRHATERVKDALVLVRSDAVLSEQLRGHVDWLGTDAGRGSSHRGYIHCRTRCELSHGMQGAVAVEYGAEPTVRSVGWA